MSIHRNDSASFNRHDYTVDGNVSLRFWQLACVAQLVVCLSAAYELRNDTIVFCCVYVFLEISNVCLVHAVNMIDMFARPCSDVALVPTAAL